MYIEAPWLMAGAIILGLAIGLAIGLTIAATQDSGGRGLPRPANRAARAADRQTPWNGRNQAAAPADYDEHEIEEPTAEITRAEMEQKMERAEAGLLKYVAGKQ